MKLSQILFLGMSVIAMTAVSAQKKVQQPFDYNKIPEKKAEIKDSDLKRWSHLDLVKDTIPGMSVDRAYGELLKKKKNTKIIVGVIDSGVDIEHEDLKSIIWTNPKEIPGNGIDDDKNGYIDDVHGWNFLGDATNENLELIRILKKGDDGSQLYKDAQAAYNIKFPEALMGKQQADFIMYAHNNVSDYLKKPDYTLEEVKAMVPNNSTLRQSKQIMLSVIEETGADFLTQITEFKDQMDEMIRYNLNKDFDGRKIVGDNPDDFNSRNYGNNNVTGPEKKHALHGTHVSGIIAEVRDNKIGGDGVANNVAIMAVRAVPNGDEYDKDVALAIRYAVDNGAKVINGSFGKSFSPHKEWVHDAIKYAATKDVLIVMAAGNESEDIDLQTNPNFPSDFEGTTEISDNVLTVGALSPKFNSKLVAEFSNYGKQNVDVFAPGVKIYASVPDNGYRFEDGTSMASPNAAGVAALVRSYYPDLSAKQVKQILMESGIPITKEVELGKEKAKKSFQDVSKSGKMVNAYNALLMAEKLTKNKLGLLN